MWFGTKGGLNKYDGHEFTVYKHDPGNDKSLSNNIVTAIYEDDSGVLWIGTEGGGLNKFKQTGDLPPELRFVDEPAITKDTLAKIKSSGKKAPARHADKSTGDKNIINPIKRTF